MEPILSAHFKSRQPSGIRLAQIEFAKRKDKVISVNTSIGNVSLPMPLAMQKRASDLVSEKSPFANGVVEYTGTVGMDECREAFLNIICASNCDIDDLHVQITEGGSEAMELMILGCCDERPLLVMDPVYTNYTLFTERLGKKIISMRRELKDDGKFTFPDIEEIKKLIREHNPGALLIIPYDNPTGQFCDHETMVKLAKICVEENVWMVSDEAYRELYYIDSPSSSIWKITEHEVPGITGRRISIESASKIWNACGLRIGALVTDNKEFHEKSVAENTANLCPNAIGQYIFGAMAHEKPEDLNSWFDNLRKYYSQMMVKVTEDLKEKLPGVIVSSPDASVYSVVDVKNIAKPGFNSNDFVLYCSREGKVEMYDKTMTLLVAPMEGFYNVKKDEDNPGKTQMRIAYVLSPNEMLLVPDLFAELFKQYETKGQMKQTSKIKVEVKDEAIKNYELKIKN
jgi:aspartate aminotransferase